MCTVTRIRGAICSTMLGVHRHAFDPASGACGGRCRGRRKNIRSLCSLPFDQAG
jgi:hypothetical protein